MESVNFLNLPSVKKKGNVMKLSTVSFFFLKTLSRKKYVIYWNFQL